MWLYHIPKYKLIKIKKLSPKYIYLVHQNTLSIPPLSIITKNLSKFRTEYKNSTVLEIHTFLTQKLSLFEDLIPLYDIFSENIYLIHKENVYQRVIYNHYRLPTPTLIKQISHNTIAITFLSNYDLPTLEQTYYRIIYLYNPEVGKNITLCPRPSFIPLFKHIKPYYARNEIINLALNMNLIKPDSTYYNLEKLEKLCHLVKTNDITANVLLQHHQYIIEQQQINMVQYYSLNGSYFMNKYLRNTKEHQNPILEDNIYSLWRLISTAPSFPKSYHVYRFISNDDFLQDLQKDDLFTDPGFLSTTRDPFYRNSQYKFGFILIKIKLPANQTGVALCIESFSHFPFEEELILPPYSTLKLISKNLDFKYYHIDDEFQSQIIRQYDFEVVHKPTNIKIHPAHISFSFKDTVLDLSTVSLIGSTLSQKITYFQQNFVNPLYQFSVMIGEKKYNLITEWYDSTVAYKNFYSFANKNGFSIYSFYNHQLLFFLEIVEPLHELHVNYYFRYSENILLFQEIHENDFMLFLSRLAFIFNIQRVIIYSNYRFCYRLKNIPLFSNTKNNHDILEKKTKDPPKKYTKKLSPKKNTLEQNKTIHSYSSTIGNYRVDFYHYLKNGKKYFSKIPSLEPKFDYFQLDKWKTLEASVILSSTDKDELYQIFQEFKNHKNKNTSLAAFYLFIIEEYCYLINMLESKISRLYPDIQTYHNPILFDYYVLKPSLFLYEKKLISSLPRVDSEIIDLPPTKQPTSTDNINRNIIRRTSEQYY